MENFFMSIEHLEPKCNGCEVILDYGVNTEYQEKAESQVCMNCGMKV